MTSRGPLLFAQYAFPPNALGYCGPADAQALLEHCDAAVSDGGLVTLARRFAGAWPYLSLIAAANGRSNPLDPAVVQAYWIGNRLLERVPGRLLAAHLNERFAHQLGSGWSDPAALALLGGRPHHNFHVFAVYPWVGMLRAGRVDEPLRVLDGCRIGWGTVTAVDGDTAELRTEPLTYDLGRLRLASPVLRHARWTADGHSLTGTIRVGDRVALHWDWICDVLTPREVTALRHYTSTQLRLVNDALSRPSVGAALEPVGRMGS